jgi:hypothetical protein
MTKITKISARGGSASGGKKMTKILLQTAGLFLFLLLTLHFTLYTREAFAATLSRAPNNLNLMGYWSLNDGAANKAGDNSGNGYTGTLNNFALSTSTSNWIDGRRGKALNFDGSNDYVSVSMASVPTSTISFWGKVGTPTNNENFGIAFHDSNTASGKLSVVLNDAGELGIASSFSAWQKMKNGYTTLQNDGKWHLFTFVISKADHTQSVIYLDGVALSSYTSSANATIGSDDRFYMKRLNVTA